MYEYYLDMADICEMKAKQYAEAEDTKLTQFYMNASLGFKRKAKSLTLNFAVNNQFLITG